MVSLNRMRLKMQGQHSNGRRMVAWMVAVSLAATADAHPWKSGSWNQTANVSSDHKNVTTLSNMLLRPSSTGAAHVINKCNFEISSNIVHGPRPNATGPPEEYPSIMRPGDVQSHPFLHDPNIGVSWKVIRNDQKGQGSGPVQLEWTWVPSQNRTYWDLSMIDVHFSYVDGANAEEVAKSITDEGVAHPFGQEGMNVAIVASKRNVTKDEGGHNCVPVRCPAGIPVCTEAYNYPEDWSKQHDCAEHVHLVWTLCG